MKPPIKTLIKVISLIIFIALFIYFILTHKDDFSSLSLVSPSAIIILIVLFIISYFFIGLINLYILSALKVPLKVKESFALSITTGFYNVITPFRGGMATRALYLKGKHNFSFTDFAISLGAVAIILYLSTGAIGIITTILIYSKEKIFSWQIFIVFLAMFLSMLSIILFSHKLKPSNKKFLKKINQLVSGWNLIKKNKKTVSLVTLLTILGILIHSLALKLQFYSLGIPISFINLASLVD